jgi:hypothetical protein
MKQQFRGNSVYLSDEVYFYARILAKAKVSGTDATFTADQIVDCELRDKWTTEHPELANFYIEFTTAK